MIDDLDAGLIELFAAEPRIGVLEASRRLNVARGTVQARLERLHARGVITGYGPDVDPEAIGHGVTAFVTLQIRQVGGHDPVAERLALIPEILEVHTITGAGDMLCRVVARTNADLQRVIDAIVAAEGVARASTVIALATPVRYRILPLVRAVASPVSATASAGATASADGPAAVPGGGAAVRSDGAAVRSGGAAVAAGGADVAARGAAARSGPGVPRQSGAGTAHSPA
jgi:DNA-binding Lrp family transcriptional regulator